MCSRKLLLKALARAFPCKWILKSGQFSRIAELADREDRSPYMTRVLRLTWLAPYIWRRSWTVSRGQRWRNALRLLEPFPARRTSPPLAYTVLPRVVETQTPPGGRRSKG